MKLLVLALFVCLVSTSLGKPEASVSLRQRRDVNIMDNIHQHIHRLIENLRKSAKHTREAVLTFVTGIQNEIEQYRHKLMDDLKNLREGIEHVMHNIADRILGITPSVRSCIEKQNDAARQVFTRALEHSNVCANKSVADINILVDNLSTMSDRAVNYTKQIVGEMKDCNANGSSILNTGACFGSLIVKTEYNSLYFTSQSALLTSKINLSMMTLPAAMEMCAGRAILSARTEAKAIMSEIAACSYSNIFTTSAPDVANEHSSEQVH